jgi:hypothetical protein
MISFSHARKILSRIEKGRKDNPSYDHIKKLDEVLRQFSKKQSDLNNMCELSMKLFQLANPPISLENMDNYRVEVADGKPVFLGVSAVTPVHEHGCNIAVGLVMPKSSGVVRLYPNGDLHIGSFWTNIDWLRKKLCDGVDVGECISDTRITYAHLIDILRLMIGYIGQLKEVLLDHIEGME